MGPNANLPQSSDTGENIAPRLVQWDLLLPSILGSHWLCAICEPGLDAIAHEKVALEWQKSGGGHELAAVWACFGHTGERAGALPSCGKLNGLALFADYARQVRTNLVISILESRQTPTRVEPRGEPKVAQRNKLAGGAAGATKSAGEPWTYFSFAPAAGLAGEDPLTSIFVICAADSIQPAAGAAHFLLARHSQIIFIYILAPAGPTIFRST